MHPKHAQTDTHTQTCTHIVIPIHTQASAQTHSQIHRCARKEIQTLTLCNESYTGSHTNLSIMYAHPEVQRYIQTCKHLPHRNSYTDKHAQTHTVIVHCQQQSTQVQNADYIGKYAETMYTTEKQIHTGIHTRIWPRNQIAIPLENYSTTNSTRRKEKETPKKKMLG